MLGILNAFVVTHWVYDRSELYTWSWLDVPRRVLVLHTGVDECSRMLAKRFPNAVITVCDVHDPRQRSVESSIARARQITSGGVTARADHLPFDANAFDLVVGFLALHAIRDAAARAALFGEIRRFGARLVVVEHVRDVANVLAYGPGAWRFLPRSAWTRPHGFELTSERTITPFVHVFAYEPLTAAAR